MMHLFEYKCVHLLCVQSAQAVSVGTAVFIIISGETLRVEDSKQIEFKK